MTSPISPLRSPFRSLGQNASGLGKAHDGRRCNDSNAKPFEVNIMVVQKEPSAESAAVGQSLCRSPSRSSEVHSRSGESATRRSLADSDDEVDGMMILHESEISIFQQLCLDRHDDNAAIEILLDSTERTTSSLQDASTNTESNMQVKERKKDGMFLDRRRKFIDRFFFKSSRKVESPQSGTDIAFTISDVMTDSSQEGNTLPSSSNFDVSNDLDDTSSSVKVSAFPQSRISFGDPFQSMGNDQWSSLPNAYSRANQGNMSASKGGERIDTFSHVSSLSSTHASSHRTPLTFARHESLGVESIMDIRKCLMEMERELGQATIRGQKVSRQKVIRALFTVADSIEDDEERGIMKTELETLMKAASKGYERSQPVAASLLRVARDDEKSVITTTDDDEDFTNDGSGFEDDEFSEESVKGAPSFDLMNSVGNVFGLNPQHREAVEAVLDDLLWTEFVSSRHEEKDYGNHNRKTSKKRSQERTAESNHGHQIPLQVNSSEIPPRQACDHEVNKLNRNPSFWRRQLPSTNLGKLTISPVRHDHECNGEESESVWSDEVPSYLPTSMTMKQAKHQNRSDATPYKVNLIDTESRLGFEMDNVSYN